MAFLSITEKKYSSNNNNTMKKSYIRPSTELYHLRFGKMLASSQKEQNVYTDDPQTMDNALVKKNDAYNVWSNEW